MQKKIKVSIITVTYNCENVIEKNIKSCLNIPYVEHIIIDNYSSDKTINILKKYEKNTKIIFNNKNFGFTKANNIGIKIAKGDYIFLLNPDAYLMQNVTENLSDILDNRKDVGAVSPVLIFPNNEIQNYTRRFPNPFSLFVESFIPKKYWNKFKVYRNYTYHNIDFSKENEVEQPAGAAIMFRNEFLLDEEYYIYVSDVELCKNIIDKGYKIIQTPIAKVVHYMSKGGTESTNFNLRMFLDLDNYYGMKYYFKKHKQLKNLFIYNIIFSFGLFFSAIINFKIFKQKIKKFFFFLKSYNFRNYL